LKKKRKKEKQRWFPFQPRWPKRPIKPPRAGPLLLFSFSFSPAALTSGARLSASPSPLSFLLRLAIQPSRRRRAIPAAPGRLPTFLSSPRSQLRQSNPPEINWDRYFPSLNPSRDGRGHQWQAAGRPIPFSPRLPPFASI
jgi:hypothetical protein